MYQLLFMICAFCIMFKTPLSQGHKYPHIFVSRSVKSFHIYLNLFSIIFVCGVYGDLILIQMIMRRLRQKLA